MGINCKLDMNLGMSINYVSEIQKNLPIKVLKILNYTARKVLIFFFVYFL